MTLKAEMSEEELRLLQATIASLPMTNGLLEIGTAAGGSLVEMLKALKASGRSPRVAGIDPMTYFPDQFAVVKRNLRDNGLDPESVDFWIGKSERFFAEHRHGTRRFDFILIDGNHKYRHVVMDLRWSDLLAPDGCLALHDVEPRFGGVCRAVNHFLRRNPYYVTVGRAGSLLILKRDASRRGEWKRRETSGFHVLCANILTPVSQLLKKAGCDFLKLT